MKKVVLTISLVTIMVVVAIVVVTLMLQGPTIAGLHYLRISVNPIVEFCTDGEKVITIHAVNEEAKELCAQEQFVGLSIDKAAEKFVDLCVRAGYINPSANDNAVSLECASVISYALENKVYNAINNYLKNSQILAVVLEQDQDNAVVRNAKKQNVSADQYVLINAIIDLNPTYSFSNLENKSERKLIKLIKAEHEKLGNPFYDYTQEELTNKHVLIDFNRVSYNTHKNAVSNESLREFVGIYNANQKQLKKQYQTDFESSYKEWREKHENYVA